MLPSQQQAGRRRRRRRRKRRSGAPGELLISKLLQAALVVLVLERLRVLVLPVSLRAPALLPHGPSALWQQVPRACTVEPLMNAGSIELVATGRAQRATHAPNNFPRDTLQQAHCVSTPALSPGGAWAAAMEALHLARSGPHRSPRPGAGAACSFLCRARCVHVDRGAARLPARRRRSLPPPPCKAPPAPAKGACAGPIAADLFACP